MAGELTEMVFPDEFALLWAFSLPFPKTVAKSLGPTPWGCCFPRPVMEVAGLGI